MWICKNGFGNRLRCGKEIGHQSADGTKEGLQREVNELKVMLGSMRLARRTVAALGSAETEAAASLDQTKIAIIGRFTYCVLPERSVALDANQGKVSTSFSTELLLISATQRIPQRNSKKAILSGTEVQAF